MPRLTLSLPKYRKEKGWGQAPGELNVSWPGPSPSRRPNQLSQRRVKGNRAGGRRFRRWPGIPNGSATGFPRRFERPDEDSRN